MATTPAPEGEHRTLSQGEYRAQWEDPFPRCALRPAADFGDEYPSAEEVQRLRPGLDPADTGPDSRAVQTLLTKSCAGWHRHPTSREFYEAVRAPAPTSRQRSLIWTWTSEAELADIIVAWAERAYTIRQLVAAMHRAEFAWAERIREINQWARR
ncbi:MAG: hypothetical protein OXH75_08575 [Acidobacteria bacterium]|nr:hypothetical protein [Acidobacteriota bacterium]